MTFMLALMLQAVAAPCTPVPDAGASGIVTYCEVEVHAEPDIAAIATADSAGLDFGGFAVRYRKDEPLDGEWVRQQAIANGLVGAPVPLDRIAAAVQQISLAYVRNGYVNSGVLIDPASDP
uniref:POTRA domain-containing protein n=1 Tax=Blastomonas sp. CCH2-A2 TaxID=1768788 RepID=UPI000A5C26A5